MAITWREEKGHDKNAVLGIYDEDLHQFLVAKDKYMSPQTTQIWRWCGLGTQRYWVHLTLRSHPPWRPLLATLFVWVKPGWGRTTHRATEDTGHTAWWNRGYCWRSCREGTTRTSPVRYVGVSPSRNCNCFGGGDKRYISRFVRGIHRLGIQRLGTSRSALRRSIAQSKRGNSVMLSVPLKVRCEKVIIVTIVLTQLTPAQPHAGVPFER